MSELKVTVVMAWCAPYRIPLFREISQSKDIDFTAIFCSKSETGRTWQIPDKLPFKSIILKSKKIIDYKYRNLFGEKNTIKFPLGLFNALRLTKPDIIVSYEFRIESILSHFYSAINGCKFVTWSDVTKLHDERMGMIRRFIRKYILSKSNAFIGSSTDTLKYFEESFNYPSEKIFLSILSSHLNDFQKCKNLPFQPLEDNNKKVRILYIGRIVKLKGLDLLISEFSILKKRFPKVILTIIGDGPEKNFLEVLAKKKGCYDDVIFKRTIQHQELAREMIKHDVFVFPSRLDVFGLVVAEAIACNLPVICSCYAGAAHDLVKDNGIIVDPTNSKEFLSALEKIVLDHDLRMKMSKASGKILERHNLKTAVHGFVAALKLANS